MRRVKKKEFAVNDLTDKSTGLIFCESLALAIKYGGENFEKFEVLEIVTKVIGRYKVETTAELKQIK